MEIDIDVYLESLKKRVDVATTSNREAFKAKVDRQQTGRKVVASISPEGEIAISQTLANQSAQPAKGKIDKGGNRDSVRSYPAYTGLFGRGRPKEHNIVVHIMNSLYNAKARFVTGGVSGRLTWWEQITGDGKTVIGGEEPHPSNSALFTVTGTTAFIFPAGKNSQGESEIVIVTQRYPGDYFESPSSSDPSNLVAPIHAAYIATNTTIRRTIVPSVFLRLASTTFTFNNSTSSTAVLSNINGFIALANAAVGDGDYDRLYATADFNGFGWDCLDQEEAVKAPRDFAEDGWRPGTNTSNESGRLGESPIESFVGFYRGHLIGPGTLFWFEGLKNANFPSDLFAYPFAERFNGGSPWLDTRTQNVYNPNAPQDSLELRHNWRKIYKVLKDYSTMPKKMLDNSSWASFDLEKENSFPRKWASNIIYPTEAPSIYSVSYPGPWNTDYYLTVSDDGWDFFTKSRYGSFPLVGEFVDQIASEPYNSLVYDPFWWEWRNVTGGSGFTSNKFDYSWGILEGSKNAKAQSKSHLRIQPDNIFQRRRDPTAQVYYLLDAPPGSNLDSFTEPWGGAPFYVTDAGWPNECREACRRLGFTLD